MKTFKQRVKDREVLSGTHINLNDPMIANIVAHLDFDYIWIDMEHSYLTLPNLLSHMMVIQNAGKPVLVRVPQDDFTFTKKILEMGPDAILFPMIRSKEQAEKLINYTLYPPYGNRGYGPGNAIKFGLESSAEYCATNHEKMCRFLQIEHTDILECLDDLCRHPYIDGFIFGPFDLSGSVGELENVFGDKTQDVIKKSVEIVSRNGKSIGLSTGGMDEESISKWHDLGINMISAGSDFGMLADGMKKMADTMKKAHGGRN